jgi:hypothetical protein
MQTNYDEQNNINEAFEVFLQPYLNQEAQEKIAVRHGENIAAKVKAIYNDALNCPVDWSTATMDTALSAMHRLLDDKYQWLSAKARTNINYAFIMSWK